MKRLQVGDMVLIDTGTKIISGTVTYVGDCKPERRNPMNWYPFPERFKVSLWSLLNQHTEVKAVIWVLEALAVGCIIAGIIWWVR